MPKPLDEHLLFFRRSAVLAGIFLLAATVGVWVSLGPPAEQARDEAANRLRIACPDPAKTANVLAPYGPGLERELIAAFCARQALVPSWRVVVSREEAFALLRAGDVDLAVGFGDDEAGSAAREKDIRAGKSYAYFRPVRIEGLELLPPDADGEESADPEYPIFSPAMDLGEAGDTLLLDPASFSLWLPLLGDVSFETMRGMLPHCWFWKENSPLDERFSAFWEEEGREEQLAELTERYYGFLPKRLPPGDILDLWDAAQNRLPAYRDMIIKAADETGVPPLLLAAVIYRESRFKPDAVSATRVRGIMQLTTATANMLGVDRNDPAQCIMGGARYLRSIWDDLADKDLGGWDRWFMTLAAYNQGPGSLNGAMRISRNLGDTGATWSELKKAYPRLRNSRGYEAIAFVDSVRYYYFILHGLIVLSPGEMQHLAPFLTVSAP
jgi:membrane-bound lytic murein transglycosylase F